jgi:hypothetical protein
VIKPKPLQAPVAGGLTVNDFTVDEQAGKVTGPAGHTVALSRTRIATFGVACRDCPLQAQCKTCKTGRTLVLYPPRWPAGAARAGWAADSGLRQDYMAHRPNVERAVAQVATWRGRRLKLRYRGTAKNHAWLKRRTAAAQPDRQRPDLARRRLGAGHLTSTQDGLRPAVGASGQASRQAAQAAGARDAAGPCPAPEPRTRQSTHI